MLTRAKECDLEFAISSDPLLRFALVSGVGVLLVSLMLLLAIMVIRLHARQRERHHDRLVKHWQPVFSRVISGKPTGSPRIFGRDRINILKLWMHLTESLRGESRARLRQLALDLKLDQTARKLTRRNSFRLRMLGIVALGRLKCHGNWNDLIDLVNDRNSILSFLAARSLLQIDPAGGTGVLIETYARRTDWPLQNVAATLLESDPEVFAKRLMLLLRSARPGDLPRFLPLLEICPGVDPWPVLEPLLDENEALETLVATLKVLQDPRGLSLVRLLAAHDQWPVRAQAAQTLGRLGNRDDVPQLQLMLRDREWWVRYRAAIALVKHPQLSKRELDDLCHTLQDRFAVDIVQQVLAETAA